MALDLIIRQGVDSDAIAYCKRSGATDRAAINAFVRGVKTLGLWSNMVCWPLRSTQNAVTSTTAYSLGGLGTFNGTLTNGPTWGADGLSFLRASSQRIVFGSPILSSGSSYTTFAAAKAVLSVSYMAAIATGSSKGCFLGTAPPGDTRIVAELRQFNGNLLGTTQFITGPTTSWFSCFACGDQTSGKIFGNAGVMHNEELGDARISSSLNSEAIAGLRVSNNSNIIDHFNGDIAIGAIWSVKLTNIQVANIYTLYKTTLGTGLGLP
jgi:hypothetical protein